MNQAPTHQELAEWLGYDPCQKALVRRWLDENGIAYKLGKGGRVCTTWEAINARLLDNRREMRLA